MEKEKTRMNQLKTDFSQELEVFVEACRPLLDNLKTLDPKQMAAVINLCYLIQGVIKAAPIIDITERIKEELIEISPSLGTLVPTTASVIMACMDEQIAYVTYAKECEEGGPKHPSCAAARAAFVSLARCQWLQLDDLKNKVEDLWHGPDIPELPWPERVLDAKLTSLKKLTIWTIAAAATVLGAIQIWFNFIP